MVSLKNFRLHLISLIILSFHSILSIFIFGEIVIYPHDNLDIAPIYSKIITEIYRGNLESLNLLQAENFKWYFLDKFFFPANLISIILSSKSFYFFELFVKNIIAYYSFYLLSGLFTKIAFKKILGAIVYVTLINNSGLLHSYFLPFAPYLAYLFIKKNKINFKYFITVFLISLNSSIIFDYMSLIVVLFFAYIFKKKNHITLFNFFFIFTIGCFISAIPIFFSVLSVDLHRELFDKSLTKINFVKYINLLNFYDVKEFFRFPIKILVALVICVSIIYRDKNFIKIFFLLLFLFFLFIVVNTNIINLIQPFSFLKGFNFSRFSLIFPLLLSLILVCNLENVNSKKYLNLISILAIVSVISLNSFHLFKEIYKSFFSINLKTEKFEELSNSIKNKNYKTLLDIFFDKNSYLNNKVSLKLETEFTFDKYYRFDDYSFLKKIIKNDIIISIGMDPMKAAMNNIKIADGYYTLYSKEYKKKFRKIIEPELDQNLIFRKYFDDWGNRAYIFFSDKDKLVVNFNEARNLNVKYVLSAFRIKNEELLEICYECNNKKNLNLYQIKLSK